jgi:hypothetical protein
MARNVLELVTITMVIFTPQKRTIESICDESGGVNFGHVAFGWITEEPRNKWHLGESVIQPAHIDAPVTRVQFEHTRRPAGIQAVCFQLRCSIQKVGGALSMHHARLCAAYHHVSCCSYFPRHMLSNRQANCNYAFKNAAIHHLEKRTRIFGMMIPQTVPSH